MIDERLLTQTVTIRPFAAGADDRYGNASESWGAGTEHPARLEQTGATEVTTGHDTLVSDWRLFLPAEVTIGGRDRVVDEDGRTFEVIGPPSDARTPRGVSHIVARLRYMEG